MSALDKLNAKAIRKVNAEVKEIPKKAAEFKKAMEAADLEEIKPIHPKEPEAPKASKGKKKNPGGRKNTRGQNGKDYKMMNIAIPMEVYEKLQAASNGNMTYYINSILKSSVDG